MIDRARRDNWRNYASETSSTKDISKLIASLEPKPTTGIGLISRADKSSLSPKESLNTLMDTHFPDSVPDETRALEPEEAVVHLEPYGPITEDQHKMSEYITYEKVLAAVKTFGPRKAPGPDGFSPIVLQHLNEETLRYITAMYKISISSGFTPKAWRKMKVIFIPKAGKDDYGQAKAYRPITLSSFLLKGLERIVHWYITDTIVTEPLYAQHAYTVGRSTDSALTEVVHNIEKGINRNGECVLAVSVDCTAAFDRILFSSAGRAMANKKIPPCIADWYDKLLKNRMVTADLQGEVNTRIPRRGSPHPPTRSHLQVQVTLQEPPQPRTISRQRSFPPSPRDPDSRHPPSFEIARQHGQALDSGHQTRLEITLQRSSPLVHLAGAFHDLQRQVSFQIVGSPYQGGTSNLEIHQLSSFSTPPHSPTLPRAHSTTARHCFLSRHRLILDNDLCRLSSVLGVEGPLLVPPHHLHLAFSLTLPFGTIFQPGGSHRSM